MSEDQRLESRRRMQDSLNAAKRSGLSVEQWMLNELREIRRSSSGGEVSGGKRSSVAKREVSDVAEQKAGGVPEAFARDFAEVATKGVRMESRKDVVFWVAVYFALSHQCAVWLVMLHQSGCLTSPFDSGVLITFIGASAATSFAAFIAIAKAHDWST